MCGRFTLRTPNSEPQEAFRANFSELVGRYNIAPTQDILTVREAEETGEREAVAMHWGLIPPWAPDKKIASNMINARAETILDKRSFKTPLAKRRCLILADSFLEWREESGAKQPYFIHRKDDQPFAFAGLWEIWKKGEKSVESCTIITTAANELMQSLHHRMPVILEAKDYARCPYRLYDSARAGRLRSTDRRTEQNGNAKAERENDDGYADEDSEN